MAVQEIKYWRYATIEEIRKGDGKVHWITIDAKDVTKPDGTIKRWFVADDGLRYHHS